MAEHNPSFYMSRSKSLTKRREGRDEVYAEYYLAVNIFEAYSCKNNNLFANSRP